MLKYIGRRLLVFVPTLLVILLISFIISRNVPGDPVYSLLENEYREGSGLDAGLRALEYQRIRHEIGLDLPTFYCGITSLAYPDTLYRITFQNERECLSELIARYGNWSEISSYFHYLGAVSQQLKHLSYPSEEKADILAAQRNLDELRFKANESEIQFRLDALDSLTHIVPTLRIALQGSVDSIHLRYEAIKTNATPWKVYVPTVQWHGLKNQFHHWLSGIIKGDFGRSYFGGGAVIGKIGKSLPWTVFLGFMSFSISFLIAIPLGIYGIRNRNKWQDNAVTIGLFLLHSIPTFVAAMLLMTFFCNQDYWQLFPTSGIASDGSELWPWRYRIIDHAYHLILPTIVLSYGSIAFVSRQLRTGMLENLQMDYIRTARAKGLPEKWVIWRHTLRNSLLPMITYLSALLPAMVSGSIIVEYIFSVPGMGLLTSEALFNGDHPITVAVFTISSVATLTGILLSDILYAFADPRISYATR